MNTIPFNPKEFLIELCKYYMEFLETDFKGKRPPSRKISFSQKEGILTDIDLVKYPRLNQLTLALLANNFQNDTLSNITRADFAIKFPEAIIREIKNPNIPSPEKIVATFLRDRKFPNRDIILKDVQNTIKDRGVEDLASYLSQYIILSFYDELYELWKNKQVLDKQDFYIYFLDIRYEDIIYPIFYIPVSIERTSEGGFGFEFDPVFLINKRAIQYVSEKFAEEQKKEWRIDLPPRHLYLSSFEGRGELLRCLQDILGEVCDFFGLERFKINSPELIEVKNDEVKITNTCYLSLFDKSDEALLNDYEELLTIARSGKDGKAFEILSKLSTDYLFENPITCEREVEKEYEAQSVSEKLAYSSPIPLNKEQLQVLRALDKSDCNLVVIEGPPGTGKSHTITAIIYDALLAKKSVLMVSDKKEALDVVEEKITQVLDTMRVDDFLQNPILRLGKKDTNYNNIFNQANYDKIKNRFNNYQRQKGHVEKEIDSVLNGIKKNIDEEVNFYLSLNPEATNRLLRYEETANPLWQDLIDLDELEDLEGSTELLLELWKAVSEFNKNYTDVRQNYKINFPASASTLLELRGITVALKKDLKVVCSRIAKEYPSLCLSKEITEENPSFLEDCLKELETLRKPLIGYLLCGKKVKLLENQFKERFFLSGLESIVENRDKLSRELQFYKYCQKVNESWANIGLDLFLVLRGNCHEDISEEIQGLGEALDKILRINGKLPMTCSKAGINILDINTIFSNSLIEFQEDDIRELREYLDNLFEILAGCTKLAPGSFMQSRRILENRLVLKMTNILDGSVVDFRENHKNDAEALRKIVRAKKKIPKDLLRELVQAFPCLIVGIRELGEFIPLEPDIFDIVVIDEASQVSCQFSR